MRCVPSMHTQGEGGEVCVNKYSLRRLSAQMFGNWTFGTLVFTVMVFTVTLKVSHGQPTAHITPSALRRHAKSGSSHDGCP